MKLITILVFLSLIYVIGCQPSEQAIQTAMAQTQAAIPTTIPTVIPTATFIPLSELDLTSVLFAEGDLPPGYEAAQILAHPGGFLEDAPPPDAFASQTLSKNGKIGGSVAVSVYEDLTNISKAYNMVVNNMPGDEKTVKVGESAQAASNSLIVETASIVFVRCHAVVAIQFMGTSYLDDVVSYAVRLDERLSSLVCR